MGISVQPCCCGGCSKCTESGLTEVTIAFHGILDRVDDPPQGENCNHCNERFGGHAGGANDVLLRSVPSDADPNDVRLYGDAAPSEFVITGLFDDGVTCSGSTTVNFGDGCPDSVHVGIVFGADYIEITLATTDTSTPTPTGSTVIYRIDPTTTPALEITAGKYHCLQSVVPLLTVSSDGHDCDYTSVPSYASIA